jgi:hypothetical protein
MPREDAATKARRLLAEGRLTVRVLSEHLIEARVRGDSRLNRALGSRRLDMYMRCANSSRRPRGARQAGAGGPPRPLFRSMSRSSPTTIALAPRSSSRSMSNAAPRSKLWECVERSDPGSAVLIRQSEHSQ